MPSTKYFLPCPECRPAEGESARLRYNFCERCGRGFPIESDCCVSRKTESGKMCRFAAVALVGLEPRCENHIDESEREQALSVTPYKNLGKSTRKHPIGGNKGTRVIKKGEFGGQHIN